MTARPFPILFITATRIGDAVLSSGLVKRLADEIPNARFTIVAGPVAAPLFAEAPGLDDLIVLRKEPFKRHWIKLWNRVRGREWGLIVDLRGSGLSSVLKRKKRGVNKRVAGPPVHKVIEAARVLQLEDDPPAPYIFVGEETQARADELIAGHGPILAMAPAANWVGKTWPTERFANVALRLMAEDGPMPDGRLLICGGPDDWTSSQALRRSIPRERWIDITGLDLLTTHACLKRARLYIGNDSGLTHLAAAAGAPTLALFGPMDERLYAPWGPNARVVRGPRSAQDIEKVDPDLSQPVCHMLDLSVEAVTAAALALFEETRGG